MTAYLLAACLFSPLTAQDSKPQKADGKGLLERLRQKGDAESRIGQDSELRERLLDLEAMMERLRAQIGDLGDLDVLDEFQGSSTGTRIHTGPEGVRVELRSKDQDGDGETEVYEAPDMESFKEKYPDIAKRYFSGGRGIVIQPKRFRFDVDDLPFGRFRDLQPGSKSRFLQPLTRRETSAGERLGVYVADLAPEIGAFLGLERGQGLLVDRVSEGTLAAALGIEARDVVYAIDDVEIFSVADVARILGAIAKGEMVEVKVNRRGRDLNLKAKKLVGKKAQEKKGEMR